MIHHRSPAAFLFVLCFAAAAAASEREHHNLDHGTAIRGYDPVSYFDGQPTKGDAGVNADVDGVRYVFVSTANRDRFVAEPSRFIPAYGGWCATAMAEGEKVDIDPKSYRITDGRLFLFYKGWLGDARKRWVKDEANLTRKADEHWQRLLASD